MLGFRSMNTGMKSLLTDQSSSWGLLKQSPSPRYRTHLISLNTACSHWLRKLTQGDMIKLLSEIKITESGKQRQAGKELLPTLMSIPVLQKSLTLTDRVWVSNGNNIILGDTATGYGIYRLKDTSVSHSGKNTSNNTGIPTTAIEPTRINSKVSIKHCSLCSETTEY